MTETSEPAPHIAEFSDKQRTKYFSGLAAKNASAFRQHIKEDLWVRNEKGERDWGNVSEHCLVEVARASILADMVRLSQPFKKNLEVAAGLHDVHKRLEKEIVTQHGLSFASFDLAGEASKKVLLNAGFSEDIVGISSAVGHTSLHELAIILAKDRLSDLDKARLIMHYVDDYTINAEWVRPAEERDGQKVNDLDRRVDNNEANPRYKVLNEEGRTHFNGETAFQAQRRIGHLVENRLVELIQVPDGDTVDPFDLPILVDREIKARISIVNTTA